MIGTRRQCAAAAGRFLPACASIARRLARTRKPTCPAAAALLAAVSRSLPAAALDACRRGSLSTASLPLRLSRIRVSFAFPVFPSKMKKSRHGSVEASQGAEMRPTRMWTATASCPRRSSRWTRWSTRLADHSRACREIRRSSRDPSHFRMRRFSNHLAREQNELVRRPIFHVARGGRPWPPPGSSRRAGIAGAVCVALAQSVAP